MTSEKTNKNENPIIRLMAILYIAIGIVEVGYFVVASSTAPPHILVLGIVSIITAYTIFTMKKWALPLAIGLFFVGITFGATTLANSVALQTFSGAMLFHIALIVYLIILLIASIYILMKRKAFN